MENCTSPNSRKCSLSIHWITIAGLYGYGEGDLIGVLTGPRVRAPPFAAQEGAAGPPYRWTYLLDRRTSFYGNPLRLKA